MADEDGMQLSDFRIGTEFTCADRVFRCTDIGTRTIIAIRIDPVELSVRHEDGTIAQAVLSEAEARDDGWFDGPPYALAEMVFDEDDLSVCQVRGLE